MIIKHINLDDKKAEFHIDKKNVKNINFRIKSDGIVYISAPSKVSIKQIEKIIIEKKKFILDALEKISHQNNSGTSLQNLKKVLYLGKPYNAEFISGNKQSVEFDGERFIVCTVSENIDEKRILIKKWYLEQAVELYKRINHEVYLVFNEKTRIVPKAVVTVKEMKTRWGSCNPSKGRISMNLRLMEYPEECIYSVFYHEYAHFIYQNHSKEFYKLLLNLCPDYRKCDSILKNLKNNFT